MFLFQFAARQSGWWIAHALLLAANGITLLIGLAAAQQILHSGEWGRVSGYIMAGTGSVLSLPLALVSCSVARKWRSFLAIAGIASFGINLAAVLALAWRW